MLKQNEQAILHLISSGKATYGVSIYHFETKESINFQSEELFYSASIIKVPIMASVFAHAAAGKCSLLDTIMIREEDTVPGDGMIQHLSRSIEWTIQDLIVLMIIESDNTATNALIGLVGLDQINTYMKEWGFSKSHLHHKLQINATREPGNMNIITAGEVNNFLKNIAYGSVISLNACNKMIAIMKKQKMNDLLPSKLPVKEGVIGMIPNWEIAHKTGYVPGIEHNVGLLYLPSHTYALSVLSKNVQTRSDSRRIMGEIGELLYKVST
ncbi:serine hydrolase [Fictibacillus nanhaiensis]|uniref:Serine hydrolase n=1 Tax=Fictibacillus nanhaiensis TaxID=742169 RepID=A0ABS2ZW47_9BACL|nr:serine hydrolase [Fictibacillus nanhaiensis]